MASDDPKPFHNPFAVLAGLAKTPPEGAPGAAPKTGSDGPGQLPGTNSPAPGTGRSATKSAPPNTPPPKAGPARAVVRMERSGRGGKEVTVIEHLALPPAQREVWLKALKSALGCGGTVEGDALLLQGDQRPRLPALLTARGVKRVTLG